MDVGCLSNHFVARELLLIEGAMLQGLGNWTAISEHIGGRTKDDVEKHYTEVYINSPDWPMPVSHP